MPMRWPWRTPTTAPANAAAPAAPAIYCEVRVRECLFLGFEPRQDESPPAGMGMWYAYHSDPVWVEHTTIRLAVAGKSEELRFNECVPAELFGQLAGQRFLHVVREQNERIQPPYDSFWPPEKHPDLYKAFWWCEEQHELYVLSGTLAGEKFSCRIGRRRTVSPVLERQCVQKIAA